jgi:hypothetical protein
MDGLCTEKNRPFPWRRTVDLNFVCFSNPGGKPHKINILRDIRQVFVANYDNRGSSDVRLHVFTHKHTRLQFGYVTIHV